MSSVTGASGIHDPLALTDMICKTIKMRFGWQIVHVTTPLLATAEQFDLDFQRG